MDKKKDFSNPNAYTFKNFYKRYGNIPDVKVFQNHTRRAGTVFDPNAESKSVNPSARLNEDLKSIEDLY